MCGVKHVGRADITIPIDPPDEIRHAPAAIPFRLALSTDCAIDIAHAFDLGVGLTHRQNTTVH
jgi:hypothetical protein